MTKFLLDILTSYRLEDDQSYNLYTFRNDDGWPWGMYSTHHDSGRLVEDFMKLMDLPYIAGLWITIESDDGIIDHSVFKYLKNFKGLELSKRGDE